MAVWEKNSIIFGLGSLIGGLLYFSIVAWQSMVTGALVAPNFGIWISYIVLQLCVSFFGAWLMTKHAKAAGEALPDKGEDERDQLIRMRAEGMQGHIMSGLVFLAMALWFIHGNSAIMFHSLVGALVLSEIARAAWQVFNYNRAY
ncbi:MAG: hypothetical protein AAGL11_03365 [Pseudomonadota bacterium]